MTDVAQSKPSAVVPATEAALEEAAIRLRAGRLVAFPTETVYGLGGDATNPDAVAAIYAAKGRPAQNPLIVHVADPALAETIAVFDPAARAVAARFWPGPLTLVLPLRPDHGVAPAVTAGLPTVAIRVPGHVVAHGLLRLTGRPVAAPSANRSGLLSPTTAAHVAASLGRAVETIVDAGPTPVGLESTILDLSGETPRLLRPGTITDHALAEVLGAPPARLVGAADRPTAPGQLAAHYAPRKPLRLNATALSGTEALLAFGPVILGGMPPVASLNLSPAGDLAQAAANLFGHLHRLDAGPGDTIAVTPIPQHGIGAALNDRLHRAAAAAMPGLPD